MVFREVYQDLMNKELRLSQNFEKLRVVRCETAMLRTPFLTSIEGILMGHQALRKRPGKGLARRPPMAGENGRSELPRGSWSLFLSGQLRPWRMGLDRKKARPSLWKTRAGTLVKSLRGK